MYGATERRPRHRLGKWLSSLSFGLFLNVVSGLTGFQLGMMYTANDNNCQSTFLREPHLLSKTNNHTLTPYGRTAAADAKTDAMWKDTAVLSETPVPVAVVPSEVIQTSERSNRANEFPDSMRHLITGFARVNREQFIQKFDTGVPWDDTKPGNQEVLILYTSKASQPSNVTTDAMIPLYTAESATNSCQTMKVILIDAKAPRECLAIVGQWQSSHIYKYMRLPPDGVKDNGKDVLHDSHPLRLVGRTHTTNNNRVSFLNNNQVLDYYQVLSTYLSNSKTTLMRLRSLAAKVAGKDKVVVVMVSNFGQSELLMNFVCSARARGRDLSHLLVFATDQATADLVRSLGISVFNVDGAFGELPTEASPFFGTREFGDMAMTKIYAVHLVTKLGYDVLLQDVDIVWYRNPLEQYRRFVYDDGFDLVFQDDGSRADMYRPFAANTGCFYVRHNDRTSFFFSSLIRFGDLVRQAKNDQSVINIMLSDHASLSGLRVKVLGRNTADGQDFPSGFHYRYRPYFMIRIMKGQKIPYLFHMSWTANKEDKVKFFQQMGNWFVADQCIGKSVDELVQRSNQTRIHSFCCVKKPVMKCHYRDMPSKSTCKNSPLLNNNGTSFW